MITAIPYMPRMGPIPVSDDRGPPPRYGVIDGGKEKPLVGPLDPYVYGAGAKEKPFPTTEQFHDWSQIFGQVSSFLQETLTPTITAPVTSQLAPPPYLPPEAAPCPITGQGRGLMPILAGVLLLILLFKE